MEMFVQGQEKTMTHLSDTAHVYQIHECMKGGGGGKGIAAGGGKGIAAISKTYSNKFCNQKLH